MGIAKNLQIRKCLQQSLRSNRLKRLVNTQQETIILASGSPRRRELLRLTDIRFRVYSADVDETQLPDESPLDYVKRMATTKARQAARLFPGQTVLAADTIVVDAGEVLGKPSSAREAQAILRRLCGRTHQVYTAIAVVQPPEDLVIDVCRTDVLMRNYSDAEIEAYIASGDPFDKAGAYAIQNGAFRPVEFLSGCYANVVGLPLCHLSRTLHRLNLPLAVDIAARCQTHLGYNCPVYREILSQQQEKPG
jgi:MAF protein